MTTTTAPFAARLRGLGRRLPVPVPVLLLVAALPLLVGFDFGPLSACGGVLDLLRLADGRELCTHGADPAPGSSVALGGDTFAGGTVPSGPVPSVAPQCYGDGREGTRVQVLYVHETGTADRAAALDADIRRWAGQAEWTVVESAAQTGGRRHVRFVTEEGRDGCRLAIATVRIPAGSLDDFADTLDAMVAAGYGRDDRKYLLFADVDLGICGLGTVPDDDRKLAENRANTTVGYARVDADCWTTADRGYYSVAAHELIHTLGGVQESAPHATDGRHCTDEWDTMCYADGAGVTTATVCRDTDSQTVGDGDTFNRLLDCGSDDYFHTSPAASSYLGTHWNTADSVFLSDRVGTGTGFRDPRRDVVADPQGRPVAWSGDLGGAVHPLLPDAYGWEVCDLPIEVLVADDAAASSSGVGGLLGGSTATTSPLRTSVTKAVSAINAAVGATVLTVGESAWQSGAVADGQLGVRMGTTVERHHAAPTVRAARIRKAVLTLDAGLGADGEATRDLFVLQGLTRTLGVDLTDTTGQLSSRYATVGADTRVTFAALRHLYATSCSKDARLDDTVAGPLSQRVAAGTRERIDLASTATTPIEAAVDVAGWLTAERSSGWADRAVICRDDVHADCLAGTALARDRGPVLYVPGGTAGTLPASVRAALTAALAPGAQVHVLGGPAAVSDTIVQQLTEALPGRVVSRVAGADRYATAAQVARAVVDNGGSAATIILTRADDPADAVAAGAAAAERGVPILLTATDRLPSITQLTVSNLGVTTVLIAGGAAAVSPEVEAIVRSRGHAVARMAGRDRFETAVAIARAPGLWNRTEVRSSGSTIALNGRHAQTWNLAIAAAPVGAYLDAPVLFTTADALPSLPADGQHVGGTLEQLRDLAFATQTPTVRTVFVGAGTWAAAATAEAFHARALPGYAGNLTVTNG